jgi:hypothetical protein
LQKNRRQDFSNYLIGVAKMVINYFTASLKWLKSKCEVTFAKIAARIFNYSA